MELIYKQFITIVDAAFDLQRYAEGGTNVIGTRSNVNAYTGVQTAQTSSNDMSPTMKEYYDTELLENARNKHYYNQFGEKQALPRNHGDTVEWRRFNTLPNADRLVEGVIPKGKNFGMTKLTAPIHQCGMYTAITDRLEMHAIDNIILGLTEELGASAGETEDISIRNVLMEGTNVMFAPPVDENGKTTGDAPVGRWGLTTACRLTPDLINRAKTQLKKLKAPNINGKYVAIIHPSVAYDLRNSEYWIEAHKYAHVEEIFNGEIGELHGVRFIEANTATCWKSTDLDGFDSLSMTAAYVKNDASAYAEYGDVTPYKATITETPTKGMVGRYVHVNDGGTNVCTVKIMGVDTKNKYIWFDTDIGITPASGDKLMPGESGVDGAAVYGCLILGKGAYGIIDPEGCGMEMIIKDKNQAGGPLNQFSTLGYKFESGTKILYQDRMIRIECSSALSDTDEDNSAPIQQADAVQYA